MTPTLSSATPSRFFRSRYGAGWRGWFCSLTFSGALTFSLLQPIPLGAQGFNRLPELPPAELARQATLGSRAVLTHDPSTIIRDENNYWIFSTGRNLRSYRSTNLTEWTAGPSVFSRELNWVPTTIPENRGGRDFWAPDIIHVGNQFLLYYSVSSFGKNTSAIGLATSPTLNPAAAGYQWTDHGPVIQSRTTNDFNAIDPAVFQDRDGSLWLAFGSFWSGIKLIQLNAETGLRLAADSPMYSLAQHPAIEAPFLYRHGSDYFLFVNWGICCRGTNSTYEIRVGRSDKVTGPYRDRDGKDLRQGGGSLILGSEEIFIGPGHAGIWQEGEKFWFSFHFYNGTQRGAATLAIRPLTWDAAGWPVVAGANPGTNPSASAK